MIQRFLCLRSEHGFTGAYVDAQQVEGKLLCEPDKILSVPTVPWIKQPYRVAIE